MKYLIIIFFLACLSNTNAQKETYNWYFGDSCGISFNTPNGLPIPLTDGKIYQWEGCSSISDSSGNLLFYTDGVTVWNKKHNVMVNGSGLNGHFSSTESALIIKKPGNQTIYYIFTIYDESWIHDKGFCYSIVDISLQNGLGEVISKNILLDSLGSERIAAVRNENLKDIWIVMHEALNDIFRSYKLTSKGIEGYIENKIGFKDELNLGYLKVSPNGKKLAIVDDRQNLLQIFDFNNKTGQITNVITYQDVVKIFNPYGLEFSPDCSKLYYTSSNNQLSRIYQLDISLNSQVEILKSLKLISEISTKIEDVFPTEYEAMQLGPDGKIYIAHFERYYLGIINKPNESGKACDLVDVAFDLRWRKCRCGLPNFMSSYFYQGIQIYIEGDSVLCEGSDIHLFSEMTSPYSEKQFLWTGPNGFISNEQNPVITDSKPEMSGYYVFKATSKEYTATDSIYITVHPRPKAEIEGLTSFCQGDSTKLTARPDSSSYKYLWNTKETTQTIIVEKAGTYSVIVENEFGCKDSTEIEITVNPKPQVKITGINEFCSGDFAVLSVNPIDSNCTYFWSTGDTSPQIIVKQSGIYKVEATNSFCCKASDSITVIVHSKPEINIQPSGPTEFCDGSTVILTVHLDSLSGTQDKIKYIWSTGDTAQSIKVSQSGIYTVIAETDWGCRDTASIEIKVHPIPTVKILEIGKLRFCRGDSVILYTDKEFASYEWSTGEITKQIILKEPGTYSVNVIDENGCTATDAVNVEVIELDINITALDNINFGNICVGDSLEKEVILTNNRKDDVLIQSISFKQNQSEFQLLTNPILPATLKSGGNLSIKIKFIPKEHKSYSNSLILEITEPCKLHYESSVIGIGKARTIVWLPEVKGKGGEANFCIPLMAKLNYLTNENINLSYNAEIRFDYTAFLPETPTQGTIQNGERILNLSGTANLTQNETELARICGTVLLGNNDLNPFKITNFTWSDNAICNETKDGSLQLTQICVQSTRKIKLITSPEIQIYPNPTGSVFTVSAKLDHSSNLNISLYSSIGDRKLEFNEKAGVGNYQKVINIKSFSSGIYFVNINIDGEVYSWSVVKE